MVLEFPHPPRPPLSSEWAALQLLRRHRNTSDSSGSDASHSESIERLDLSTCVCSHLVCESSDKPITCDTGLIDTAVATVHEVVGLCQACGMHLDPTSLNFHCHGTTRHITQSQVFGIESAAGREGFTLAVSQDVSIVVG